MVEEVIEEHSVIVWSWSYSSYHYLLSLHSYRGPLAVEASSSCSSTVELLRPSGRKVVCPDPLVPRTD